MGLARRIALVLLGVGLLQPGIVDAGGPEESTAVNASDIGPVAGLIGDLIHALEQAKKDLERARTEVGTQLGPLQEPTASEVEEHLMGAADVIAAVLDPESYPSLVPATAGSADPTIDPTTLPDYAAECVDLIDDALDELNAAEPDHEIVGSRLRTIDSLMTGYYDEAGL